MTGVVRPRNHFVDQELPLLGDKKLHTQHPHYIQHSHQSLGQGHGLGGYFWGQAGRGDRDVQDMVVVLVFDGAKMGKRPIAAAGRHNGDFVGEGDEGFEDEGGGSGRVGD